MPRTEFSDQLHAMKYRGLNENFEESVNRFAFGLADDGPHYHAIRDICLPQRFCPGGRIQGAIGATRQTTAHNCYVSGTIADSIGDEDSKDGIMDRLKEAALTSRLGGGIGYDFSTLRPRGARVRRIESNATGPVSFMEYFNAMGLGISSSGHRRGAQMAILRVSHPDIEEFVYCKQKPGALEGFNISVAVTDKFMEAVYADGLFMLEFGGVNDHEVRALDLWNKIMRAAWDWAEPGVVFIDAMNSWNNLYYCEKIAATNPCSEQPLPPFGACLLGSFNLPQYLTPTAERAPQRQYYFDFLQLRADIAPIVRAMDNVNDKSLYPLAAQRNEALSKRRMGLGVMGLANAGEVLGHPYGSPGFLAFEAEVLQVIRDETYRASALLAAQKGSFPLYDAEKYVAGRFIQTLPDDVRSLIKKHGIRNSHLTSIAPTGTISLCADNVSGGIEPVFDYVTRRIVNTPDGARTVEIDDFARGQLGILGKLSAEVTPQEHVDVLVTAQKYVDSAVSKTCNTTGETPWDEFLGIYSQVYKGGGKGCTVFNRDGKRTALLTTVKPDEGASCEIDPATGRRDCA
jgi:ribonucleoside-diphosphate reductase alpha chain